MLLAKRLINSECCAGLGWEGSSHHMLAPQQAACMRSCTVAHGFVGQANTLAAEYHSSDYDWTEHTAETAPLVDAQWAGAPQAVRSAAVLDAHGRPLSAVAQLLQQLQGGSDGSSGSDGGGQNSASQQQPPDRSCVNAAAAAMQPHPETTPAVDSSQLVASPSDQRSGDAGASRGSDGGSSSSSSSHGGDGTRHSSSAENEWELFYRLHPAAKFFKERRYLLLEFPCLAPPSQLQHVVEIGAGCGSSILPVLRAQPQARATVSDVSSTCLQQLLQAMQHLGLDPQRVEAFTADGTSPALGQRMAGADADAVLIMFTLSAVMPEGMLGMVRNAAAALRPGGVLCIRDHALYDMVQLRIPAEQCIARHLYRRGDDTLAYFYTTEELAGLAKAAGLEEVECEYVCVVNRNRKTGQALRRSFVHGLFRKPAAAADLQQQ